MQFKLEVPQLLQAFILFARTQFLTNIKTPRTDNGLEFFGKDMQVFNQTQ